MPNLQEQRRLLHIEYEYEKAQFRRDTETMGIGRKVKRGLCWFPVSTGRAYYNSLNQYVVEIYRNEDEEIEHLFEYGRSVNFFIEDGSGMIRYLSFIGVVSFIDGNRMVVSLPDASCLSALQDDGRLGVQLYFDETSYRLMFEALDKVIGAREGRMAQLRDIFHGDVPLSKSQPGPMRFPWLNTSQESAVNEVLRAKDVAVVHGPFGTGKTTTLVEAIYETLRRESQVMVCAQSNMAVDWICEKLLDRGISVLRVGNPSRVTDTMLSSTYEYRFENHSEYPKLWAIRRNIRQMQGSPRNGRTEAFLQKLSKLRDDAAELERKIREDLFEQSRVIASTLVGSASSLLVGRHFHTLFIDEAAQALEAACWIAISHADRVILAGDHQQLPPTVKSDEALRGGLDHTLMQIIVDRKPQAVSLLTVQYRMNETLMRFSSDYFYQGRLVCAPEVRDRSILDFDSPASWIDTSDDSSEEFVGGTYGRINRAEADLTLQTLIDYIHRIGRQRMLNERIDFGIISPYRAQVQLLRRLIFREHELKPFRDNLTVNTVDGFQGQERDVILISLVRANEGGEIGFLRDLRRMNVAMTRARMKLIILGSTQTLTRHPFYKKLYDYIVHLDEF